MGAKRMNPLDGFIDTVNSGLGWVLLVILIGVAIYLSVRTGFVQLRLVPEMFRVIGETAGRDETGRKSISSFQAFCISAASRVGTGNIAGIALAISIGGPGAVFWMWVMAILGSATAFVESTLGQLYKVKDKGSFRGGPAYYMSVGLRQPWMGALFAVIISVTYGLVFNSLQANSIVDATATSLRLDTATNSWMPISFGIGLALITGLIFLGGVHRISNISAVIVPVMAVAYLILGAIVVVLNITEVPAMFALIVSNALGFDSVVGGGIGIVIMQGVRRGLFSNEAGMGSVPNAAATSSVSHPAKQGLVQSLGVYFDTLLVCSITAFIVLLSNPVYDEAQGASLTQNALASQLGGWAVHFLTIAIFLFAFSSILGNYYYGEANIAYLFKTKARPAIMSYRVIVMAAVFTGSVIALPLAWSAADIFMSIMALTNLVAVFFLAPTALRLLKNYTSQRKMGLEPVFHRSDMPDIEGLEAWDGTDEVTQREFWEAKDAKKGA
ncbi:alanine/glycine:cation symporter family protein [Brevibacterium sp.]|uniref:alanine/glycine:cation symporter family protein n=1 Tax=Brevibacterium sp. TaxID=1701 RepID=UPI002812398E|nr:alanine/glycine:cation symporter family protein [Brevibacterium sp.]